MHDIVPTLLGMAGLLALVSALPPLAGRLNVPFTVLLAAVGVLLGLLIRVAVALDQSGPFSDFVKSLNIFHFTAEAFFYLFLPVLLFETAFTIDVRRLIDDLAPILLLAVVAVVVTTLVAGYALAAVSGIDLVGCLLLAAIIATTDPAAVIGIFRDLGAPRRLCMLVEGESLLNDAAAIVIFTLLLDILTGERTADFGAAIVAFLRSFCGGIVVGYLIGRLACLLVGPMRDQPRAEISLTVAFAYLSFILAEHYAEVSGVVSVVVTALVVGSVGRTRVSPTTWSALEHVWHQLGFWANSLIFVFAAMLVPETLRSAEWSELGLLLVLVAAALVARAAVLFGLLPVLSRLGASQAVSHAYKTVILWGGLRGAVSLVLALAVTESRYVPQQIEHFVGVLATGFVLFTLFINGTTLRPLIRLLGLDKLPPGELAVRNRALLLSLTTIRDEIDAVARAYQIRPEVVIKTAEQYELRIGAIQREIAGEPPLSEADLLTIGLIILINREEELYFKHYEEGVISRRVVEVLTERTGWLLDGTKSGGLDGYEAMARRAIGFTGKMRLAVLLQRSLGLRAMLARRLAVRSEALLIVRMVLHELGAFNRSRLASLLGEDCAEALAAVLRGRLAAVEQALSAIKIQYPDFALVLQHQYLGRAALRMEETGFVLMCSESLINQEILNDLRRQLEQRRRALERPPRLDLGLRLNDLVARLPMFAGLPERRLHAVVKLLRPRLALPGEMLLRRGDFGSSMYFISSGEVEVLLPGTSDSHRLGPGDFFGELGLLSRQPRTADVRALGYCRLLELDERDFRRLIEQDDDLRRHIMAVAEKRRVARSGSAAGNPKHGAWTA
ncbi:MAG: cyclic nucleotide-binding domain-containing protein [Azospirillum sp.]|nr:cyclic nucleotide-binding domain-containing protein [Azospirillum sp.]